MMRQNERQRSMNKKTLWVCRTAVMIAVLVALQFATKAMGQFVTGSCVNMVLVVATLCGGFWCGFATALVSPFLAYLLGIGPALIQLVPAIALGNISLAAIYALIYKKLDKAWLRDVLAVVLAAAVKLAVLFLLIAVLTMVTTMHRLTAKEKTQIGTLKALGFKDKRILRHYSCLARL